MIDEMEIYIGSAKNYILELEGGKKSSSARARSEMMKIKNLSHLVRKGCITSQKNIPVKSRVKVTPVEVPEVVEVPMISKDSEVVEVEPAKKLPKKSKAKAKKSN
jgi:hypothetical protein